MTLLGAHHKDISFDTENGFETEVSKSRLFGLTLYLCLVIGLEVIMPRLSGGQRIYLPLFLPACLGLILANRQHVIANLSVLRSLPMAAFACYLLWMFISVLWSPVRGTTVLQSGVFIVAFVAMLGFADIPAKITARKMIAVITGVCIVSWLFIVVPGRLATIPDVIWRLNGIMMNAQRLCLLTGMALILQMALWGNSESSKPKGWAIFLTFTTMMATRTRAFSTFAILSVFTVYFWKIKSLWIKTSLFFVAIVGVLIISFAPDAVMGLYSREESNDATLTGRTTIWEKSIEMIYDKPIIGYGYTAFDSPLTAWFFEDYQAPHAHNTWINTAFETGFVGLFLLVLFQVSAFWIFIRIYLRTKELPLSFGLLIFITLCGLTGVVLGGRVSPPTCMVLLLMAQEFMRFRELLIREGNVSRENGKGLLKVKNILSQ